MPGKLFLFTDSTFEEFQELEYDASGRRTAETADAILAGEMKRQREREKERRAFMGQWSS